MISEQDLCSLHQVSVQDHQKRSPGKISVQDLYKSTLCTDLHKRPLGKTSGQDIYKRSLGKISFVNCAVMLRAALRMWRADGATWCLILGGRAAMLQAASLSLVYFKVVSCDFVNPPKATYVRNQMLFSWFSGKMFLLNGRNAIFCSCASPTSTGMARDLTF